METEKVLNPSSAGTALLPLRPHLEYTGRCPVCSAEQSGRSIRFFSKFIFGKADCQQCGAAFYFTLPAGHAAGNPFSLLRDGTRVAGGEEWLTVPVQQGLTRPFETTVRVEIVKKKVKCQDPVLHHLLDDCYGHVIARLINAVDVARRLPERHHIFLLAENFLWMLPANSADEVWLVKVEKMSDFLKPLDRLNLWIQEQLSRFDRLDLAVISVVPNLDKFFPKEYFNETPYDPSRNIPLTLTFIWREDRFWLRWGWQHFLQLISVRFGFFPLLRPYFCRVQSALVNRLERCLRSGHPQAGLHVAGIGTAGRLNPSIHDHRCTAVEEKREGAWCRLYAGSRVVTGVHGSGMMIPSALSGGVVEILPAYKRPHRGEDILRDMQQDEEFRISYVSQFVSPRRLAGTILQQAGILQ